MSSAMLCREVRGTNWGPLQCCKRAPEVHKTFDVSKWGQDSGGFTPGANGQWTLNLPHPRGGSQPPAGRPGAARGSRSYCISPGMSGNSWTHGTYQADWCSEYPVPSKLCHDPSWKTKNSSKGLSPKACQPLTQISPATGSRPTSRRVGRYPTGGGNFGPSAARVLSPSITPKSKHQLPGRLWPSGCPLPNKKRVAGGVLHPAWVCWNEISSLCHSMAAMTSKWCSRMKWWCWPRLFNSAPYNQECPQGYCVELSRSSADALPLCLRKAICWTLPCWEWWRRILWLLLSLQKGPNPWRRNQNTERKS